MANFQLDRLMKLSLTILPASSPFSPKIWNCINGHKLQYRLKFVCLFFCFFLEDCSEPTASQSKVQHCHSTHVDSFFFDMSIQGKRKGGFELVTSALLSVVYSRLSYLLGQTAFKICLTECNSISNVKTSFSFLHWTLTNF
jgi:hypothetical protein